MLQLREQSILNPYFVQPFILVQLRMALLQVTAVSPRHNDSIAFARISSYMTPLPSRLYTYMYPNYVSS